MIMETAIIIKISLYAVSLALVAFFSGTETALTSLSTITLSSIKEKPPSLRGHVAAWEKTPGQILAAIIVWTTLSIIGSGVLATSLALDFSKNFAIPKHIMLSILPAAAAVITLVFGEIIPKILSRYFAEQVAVRALGPMNFVNSLIAPLTKFLLKLSENVIRLFSRKYTAGEKPSLNPDELKILLLSDETLSLPDPAKRIMENIFDFGKTRVSRVMVPRSEIQAVSLDQNLDKIIDQIIEKGYSRVPVYRSNLDNIVGIIYSKDLALAWRGGSLFVIDDLVRPAYFVPASARIDKVLREFKTGHQHMAIVVDEFGSTVGLATIEDLVEEIVGDIWDEYDIQEKTIIPFPDGSFMLMASENLEQANRELGFNLPAGEFNSISGWILDLFGRIPRVGDTVKWGDLEIEVVDADKRKVQRVKIKKVTGAGKQVQ